MHGRCRFLTRLRCLGSERSGTLQSLRAGVLERVSEQVGPESRRRRARKEEERTRLDDLDTEWARLGLYCDSRLLDQHLGFLRSEWSTFELTTCTASLLLIQLNSTVRLLSVEGRAYGER